jgi:hypothetical protein
MKVVEIKESLEKFSKDDVILAIVGLMMSRGMKLYDMNNVSCSLQTLAGPDGMWCGDILVRLTSKNGKPIGTVQVDSAFAPRPS